MSIASYAEDVGVTTALALINVLDHVEPESAIREILAVDPPSQAAFSGADVPGMIELARLLRSVAEDLDRSDVDAAAEKINAILGEHPARPHLAKDDGRWHLHHHPAEAALVPMWTSICAEAFARVIGAGYEERVGICGAADCDRVYLDVSKNGSRQFCSTTCQNRVKAAAFRRRARQG